MQQYCVVGILPSLAELELTGPGPGPSVKPV